MICCGVAADISSTDNATEYLPNPFADFIERMPFRNMLCRGLADGPRDRGEGRKHSHMVEQFGGFGNAGCDAEAGGGGNVGYGRAFGEDDRLAGAHQADGDAGGFAGGGVAEVDAAIDGRGGGSEVALGEVGESVDGRVFGFVLQETGKARRNGVAGEQEGDVWVRFVKAAKGVY